MIAENLVTEIRLKSIPGLRTFEKHLDSERKTNISLIKYKFYN